MIPSLFLAHGSPMLAIEETEYAAFLGQLGKRYQPKAIVVFTAHWETEPLAMTYTDDEYETIYDFGGFPDELYQIKYRAKGSKTIAEKLEARFQQQGIPVVRDSSRGLDHGTWTLLHRMYPAADIPLVQLSVNPYRSPEDHYKIGEALHGLGEEDIMIIGSGVTVHNLRIIKWGQKEAEPWAVQFDDWLLAQMADGELDALFHYEQHAPHARMAVPRAEHFVPLYIAMGSGSAKPEVIYRGYDMGTLSYLSLQF
ncbi:4,5-DOPA dioxygenase extradiol [Paenibacillus phyllosphaerae]|uniref:4,5-DOPA dioxygenase extradiol n=1 Tax=Paenibacillus phyllosphaerae TaxID=274593 RepID=A0A7W5FPY2_9BACL|nr:class III extradiol ring-cleavage dioxygenase [Paenibacillus phyllosphaerae]MBB3112677.1 4,5-DOPA dioxygenase extradiol [Paenibacillus phyllosphaerae]